MAKGNLKKTADWLLLVGGLNWGLTAFNFNLVEWVAGLVSQAWIEPVVYGAIGLSAVFAIADRLGR